MTPCDCLVVFVYIRNIPHSAGSTVLAQFRQTELPENESTVLPRSYLQGGPYVIVLSEMEDT